MSREPRRGLAPECPFCGKELARPAELKVSAFETALGGTCACGAIYLVDPTGKNVGTVMVQAMGMAADSLAKNVTDLTPDEDYEEAVLSYDWRIHRSPGVSGGYMDGYGRLYVIKVKTKAK